MWPLNFPIILSSNLAFVAREANISGLSIPLGLSTSGTLVEAPSVSVTLLLWSGLRPLRSFSLGEVGSEIRGHCGGTEGALDVEPKHLALSPRRDAVWPCRVTCIALKGHLLCSYLPQGFFSSLISCFCF